MDRDVYFLATTAEEIGLLGATAFAENPPLPLGQIVAAFNLDSFALAPRGTPLGIVGRGMTPLDPQILAVAKAQKRKVVDGDAVNAYVRRQDGWALLKHDIPTVMVSSSWSDVARVERFFETDYHRPGDQVKATLDLSGTAEDVAFHVVLVRHFADPRKVPSRSK
jgi:Zn-dependent M28 family amino/carboxypeptidase